MELSTFGIYPASLYKSGRYKTPSEAFKAFSDLGFGSTELASCEFSYILSFDEYKENFKKHNIKLKTVQIITSFAEGSKEKYLEEIEKAKADIDKAQKLGAELVMVVPEVFDVHTEEDKIKVRDLIIKGMKELVDYAKNTSVTVTMENFSLHEYPYSTIDEMEYILKEVDGLKFTLDSGNFYCVGNDVIKAYDRLKDYIVNVHLKDFRDDENGIIIRPNLPVTDGCALGKGKIPLKELIQRLKSDNYDGDLVFEINSSKLCLEDIVASVDFIRGALHA